MSRFLLIVVLAASPALHAETLEDMVAAGHLKLRTWVSPDKDIVTGQQVTLNIEIAVAKWFRGGTRIGRFDMADTIVLQRDQLAVNSSRREGRNTWAVQKWSLSLYPQKTGRYEVPPVELKLKLAGWETSLVEGKISTEPVAFETMDPEPLKGRTDWLAAPSFSITEAYSRDDETFKPGDALQRTVNFEAPDLVSMMLPAMIADPVEGLAVYAKPPRLEDLNNRGNYTARRTETITYMMEKPGSYTLPELSFTWWDLRESAVKTITLPERSFTVEGELPVEEEAVTPEPEKTGWTREQWLRAIGILVAALFLLLLIRGFVRMLARRPAKPRKQPPAIDINALRHDFIQACHAGDHQQALSCLYRWLDHDPGNRYKGSIRMLLTSESDQELARDFDALTQKLYGGADTGPDLNRFARRWQERTAHHHKPPWRQDPVHLTLNG
ncbi:MAG: BatD family protein [Acidobacteriota bacterium]|nr:BatD family protein [Acidobacteriota bacterium]